jgi:MoaE-MoaD fusion protein
MERLLVSTAERMRVTVLYFAVARERARMDRETIELPAGAALGDLRSVIAQHHASLSPLLSKMRMAVNQEFRDEVALEDGDEIAVIPPVAGGIDVARVVNRPIDLNEVVDAVRGSGCGGVVTFTGAVRGESHGRKVLRLEYEAYVPMAEERLRRIGTEIESQSGCRVAVLHRVGVLHVGETAVVIAVASPHRRAAFDACARVIDRLKEEVPIWKKEVFEDGSEWVGMGP